LTNCLVDDTGSWTGTDGRNVPDLHIETSINLVKS